MQAIGMAVQGLDDLEALTPKLRDLGKMHFNYGAKAEHYPVVGEALIITLKAGMRSGWNEDIETAWNAVFQIV